MAKPKGVIAGVGKVLDLARSYPGTISAVAGGAAKFLSGKLAGITAEGAPVFMRRKRRRGLTYSDIKGATRVLKLVKKFAPPGSRAKLRMRPRTY